MPMPISFLDCIENYRLFHGDKDPDKKSKSKKSKSTDNVAKSVAADQHEDKSTDHSGSPSRKFANMIERFVQYDLTVNSPIMA